MGTDGGAIGWGHDEKFPVKFAVVLHFNAGSQWLWITRWSCQLRSKKKRALITVIQAVNTTRNFPVKFVCKITAYITFKRQHTVNYYVSRFWAYSNSNEINFCLWKTFPCTPVMLKTAWLFYNLTFQNDLMILNVFSFVLEA